MKKKTLKILALVLAIILIIGVAFFANSLVGNPISKYLATKSANEHIEKNYSDKDFVVESVNYDFKTGDYHAKVTSPTSIDSHFTIQLGFTGKVFYDTYDDITTGWNTAYRLDEDYRNAVKSVTESQDFSEKYFVAYGEIPCVLSDYPIDEAKPDYALKREELVLDKVYDIRKIGAEHGKLVIYAYDEEVTEETLSKFLLEVKEKFDKSGVTFKAIDFVLEAPKQEDSFRNDDSCVEVKDFLYSDIYEDGLVDRVKEANQKAIEYNKEMYELKEQEIADYNAELESWKPGNRNQGPWLRF